MRRFFVQFGQFSGAFLALLFLLEVPVQWNYKTQNADMADWQKLEGINADIVFIGNSRTWHSLDAHTASQKTEKNIYALAQDGWQARLLNHKLKTYLKQNKQPDFIFIQSDPAFLGTRTNWYSKSNFLKYLFLDREGLQDLMKAYEGYHWWDWCIPAIRYAGLPGRYIIDATGSNMGIHRRHGTLPESAGVQKHLPQIPMDVWKCSKKSTAWIDSLKGQCPSSQVVLWHPPISQALSEKRDITEITSYSIEHNVPLIDLGKASLADSLFKDNTHVNKFGSIWTTDTVVAFIQEINALQQP
jgi:hypothetical protein